MRLARATCCRKTGAVVEAATAICEWIGWEERKGMVVMEGLRLVADPRGSRNMRQRMAMRRRSAAVDCERQKPL